MVPRDSLDAVEKKKSLAHYGISNSRYSVVQPVASYFPSCSAHCIKLLNQPLVPASSYEVLFQN